MPTSFKKVQIQTWVNFLAPALLLTLKLLSTAASCTWYILLEVHIFLCKTKHFKAHSPVSLPLIGFIGEQQLSCQHYVWLLLRYNIKGTYVYFKELQLELCKTCLTSPKSQQHVCIFTFLYIILFMLCVRITEKLLIEQLQLSQIKPRYFKGSDNERHPWCSQALGRLTCFS